MNDARSRLAHPAESRQTSGALTELPPTITIEQAGQLLGISRRAAYRAASAGELPTFEVGRRLLVPTARLLELLGLPMSRIAAAGVDPPA